MATYCKPPPIRTWLALLSQDEYRAAYARFLERLRAARREAGLTQTEVASLLGKPQSFVSKAESGERRIDFVELQLFARVYRKQLSYFQE